MPDIALRKNPLAALYCNCEGKHRQNRPFRPVIPLPRLFRATLAFKRGLPGNAPGMGGRRMRKAKTGVGCSNFFPACETAIRAQNFIATKSYAYLSGKETPLNSLARAV